MAIEWTTAARIALQGYNKRHLIQEYWTKALAKLNLGSTDIVVTGHSAVGKSYLAFQLHGKARELFFEAPKESIQVEVEALTIGEWTQLVRVLPGQQARRVSAEIESIDNNGDLQGVIHVVDFGYVAPRDPAQAHALVNSDGIDTTEKLRQHNLRVELRELTMLINSLMKARENHGGPKWLVIAVNKVDLFSRNRDEALSYYHPDGTGDFGKELKRLQSQLGSSSFGIYVVPTCANEADFSWNGQVVKSELAKNEKDTILRSFVTNLAEIMEKHS